MRIIGRDRENRPAAGMCFFSFGREELTLVHRENMQELFLWVEGGSMW